MTTLDPGRPEAVALVAAIRAGDVDALRGLLSADPQLATARIGDDDPDGMSRSLLHVATDWPGHFPNGPAVVRVLVEAGADVNARFHGPHVETPLHWAASSDDVAVLDALLDLGADIEAPGAVIGGGTPLADACGFRNWAAGLRLVERGAATTIPQLASLGLVDRLRAALDSGAEVNLDTAFWYACHGGRTECAALLLDRGADLNWVAHWEPMTALDTARQLGADELAGWLRERGARTAAELSGSD